jgi:hypothetical protein
MKYRNAVKGFFGATAFLIITLGLLALSGCQEISVDTERLQPPTIFNGQADGRFVTGHASDTVTISNPNAGSTIRYQINGGAAQTYTLPLTLTANTQIDAWVEKPGLRDSAVVSKQFTLAWRTLSDVFPSTIDSHTSVAIDDTIWIAGGFLNEIPSDKVFSYIPGTNPIEQATKKLPEARRGLSMVVYDGDLYVIGGAATTSANNDDVLVLNLPDATSWTILSNAFETRINSQAVLYVGTIYMPFGYGGSSTLNNWGVYSITGNTSTSISNSLTIRQGCAATLLGTIVYSIGGTDGNEEKIHRYDVFAGEWLSDETLGDGESVNWAQGSTITIGSRIFVFNGTNTYIRETNGTWRKDMLPIPRAVFNSSAALLNGKVYITGGTNAAGLSPVNTILEFTPP